MISRISNSLNGIVREHDNRTAILLNSAANSTASKTILLALENKSIFRKMLAVNVLYV